MKYHQCANGLKVPLLPNRGWDTEAIMGTSEGYTPSDAVKVIEYLWWQYADDVEVIFLAMIDVCDKVAIDLGEHGDRLVYKFVKYPARPALAFTGSDLRLARIWREWAVKVEEIYVDLRDTIGRSAPVSHEHERPDFGVNQADFGIAYPDGNADCNSKHVWQTLRILLQTECRKYGSCEICQSIELPREEGGTGSRIGAPRESPTHIDDLAVGLKNMGV